jgi:phage virion morphogenesis protein
MDITVTIDDHAVRTALEAVAARVNNLAPLFHEIGQYYEGRVLENFAKESDPAGNKWAPLSKATLMMRLGLQKGFEENGTLSAKGKQFLTTKALLFQSGNLRKSIHYQSTATSVIIGTGPIDKVPKYAGVHQLGTNIAGRGRKVSIPARPYLAMNKGTTLELAPRDRDEIVKMVSRYIGT